MSGEGAGEMEEEEEEEDDDDDGSEEEVCGERDEKVNVGPPERRFEFEFESG